MGIRRTLSGVFINPIDLDDGFMHVFPVNPLRFLKKITKTLFAILVSSWGSAVLSCNGAFAMV